ncbi:MAG: bifunctional pantoate--beta-alanine ligase/(d)CMP kinase [Cyanobacteria bacterium]|nr:bifunctional pantoate--beta-alanine ligase/(d)CMP kinase [Cyanobacteriota bacterium]
MRLLHTCAELGQWCQACDRPAGPLQFVPTMGGLHQGHQSLLALADRARAARGGRVLLSVFVNPLQFGPAEDLDRYPRDLGADAQLAAAAGADALFAPSVAELYPGGPAELTRLLPPASLVEGLCGRSRPGHFAGVATVVARLLALVRPDVLWLGEKDWQQLVILRRLVADLGLPLVVRSGPTLRQTDGLPLSSRNRYLSPQQQQQALALPRSLAAAAQQARQAQSGARDSQGSLSLASLIEAVRSGLLQAGLAVDYVEAVEPRSLRSVETLQTSPLLLAAAAYCGTTRLIDHVFLMRRPPIIAIDGPAGAGKSTVTKAFAARLGLIYLDTGAMYRAVTWLVAAAGVDPAAAGAVGGLLADLDLQLSTSAEGAQRVTINGQDVTEAIRSPEITSLVSVVAAHGCVREALTRQQQAMGARGGLVAEGRDIGTAVFPDAELKVFLTATVGERARRRALDLAQKGFAVPELAELAAQIAERDHLDSSRAVAPLIQAADAVELITDGLSIAAVIDQLELLFRERVPADAWPGPAPA